MTLQILPKAKPEKMLMIKKNVSITFKIKLLNLFQCSCSCSDFKVPGFRLPVSTLY